MTETKKSTPNPYGLRMPDGIKMWVKKRAIDNRRTLNAEICMILEKEMKNEKSGAQA